MLPVGRYPTGVDATIEQIAADLAGSRFGTLVSDDVMRWKYAKLLGNLANSIEALCGRQARDGDAATELRDRTRAEALAVFAAAGIGYAPEEEIVAARGDQVRTGAVNGSSRAGGSSWQSLSRGTGTIEADFLNGEIVLLGRQHGVPTPVNAALQKLANQAARDRKAPGSTTPAEILSQAVPQTIP
jgi:2-dehydropantoate 2-reductase